MPQWTTVLGALLLMLVIGRPAAAGTFRWTGAGGNTLWTTGANWQGNVAPTTSIGDVVGEAVHIEGVLNGSGALLLGSGQLTITSDQNATFSGPISGTGVLKKVGDATLTLTGVSNAFTGQLENVGGILEVNVLTGADAEVQGTMRGYGTVAELTRVNGALVP